jgi:hypothetical protein
MRITEAGFPLEQANAACRQSETEQRFCTIEIEGLCDAIRQILADWLLQRLARQNLAYCVSAHFSSRAISRVFTVLAYGEHLQ